MPAEHLHCGMTFFNPLILFWRDRTPYYLENIHLCGVLRTVVGTATAWSKMSLYLSIQRIWALTAMAMACGYHFHTIWWSLGPGGWGALSLKHLPSIPIIHFSFKVFEICSCSILIQTKFQLGLLSFFVHAKDHDALSTA